MRKKSIFLGIIILLIVQQSIAQINLVKTWYSPKDFAGVSYNFDSIGCVKFHSFTCLSEFNRTGSYKVSNDTIFILYKPLQAEEKKAYGIKTDLPTSDTLFIIDNSKIKVSEKLFIYDKIIERPSTHVQTNKIIGIAFDSTILYTNLNNFENCIRVNYNLYEFSNDYQIKVIDSLKKKPNDTIYVSGNEYEEESNWLVQKNQVIFYDKKTNKIANHIKHKKQRVKNMAVYCLYIDRDTHQILYRRMKKNLNPQKF